MAFPDFTFPQVQQDLGIALAEAELFSHVSPVSVRSEFALEIADAANLALAVNTAKAKSEFIIAPILLELRRMMGRSFGLFSGVEFNVDASRGLNGFCDFLLTRDARQFIVSAPLLAVVEAKNDNIRLGLGQCIASMYAARIFNERDANAQTIGDLASPVVVHGVVTTGGVWRFLRLSGDVLTLDIKEYYVDNLGAILGALREIMQGATPHITG